MIVLADLIPRIIRDKERATYKAKAFINRKQEAFDNGEVFPHLLQVERSLEDISSILRQTDQQKAKMEEHEEIEEIYLFEDLIERKEISAKETAVVTHFLQDFKADLQPVYADGKDILSAAKKQLSVHFVSPIPPKLDSGFLVLHQGCIYPRSQSEEASHMILKYEKAAVLTKSSSDRVYRQLDSSLVSYVDGNVEPGNIREFLVSENHLETGESLLLIEPESEDNAGSFAFNETVKPIGGQLVNMEIQRVVESKRMVDK